MNTEPNNEPDEIVVDVTEQPVVGKDGKTPDSKSGDAPVEVVADKLEPREIITPDEGVDKLKANLEAANRRAEDEARKRHEAEAQLGGAAKQVQDGELREVTNAIEIVTRDLDTAKSNYRAARAAGDVDGEIAATESMADAKSKLNALESGRAHLEARAKQPPQRQAASPNDPAEALARSMEEDSSPRSAAWVRAHPQYAQNQKNYDKMLGAHFRAKGEGLIPETDAYFDFINKDLGHGATTETPVVIKTDPTPEQPMSAASRPVSPPAAPVSRQAPGTPKPGTVRLTRAQAEAAEFSFPDMPKAEAYRMYARNMQTDRPN